MIQPISSSAYEGPTSPECSESFKLPRTDILGHVTMGDSDHFAPRIQTVQLLFAQKLPAISFESSPTSFPTSAQSSNYLLPFPPRTPPFRVGFIAPATDIMERGYLGAGVICRACFEPFGRLEDRKARYSIQCGHTMCLGCLIDYGPCCCICAAGYDARVFSRLCNLGINGPPQPPAYTEEERAFWLQEAMSEVTATTSLHYMKHLYNTANTFLGLLPASQFRELSTNANLLKVVIETKCSSHLTQSQLTKDLTDTIGRLTSQISVLQRHLEILDAEKKFIEDNVGVVMRRDPNYNLLESEVLNYRHEMNDLQEEFLQLRRKHREDMFIPPLPDIRVHPASTSPSPDYGHHVHTQYGTGVASNSFHRPPFDPDLAIDLVEPASSMPTLEPSSASDSDGSPPGRRYLVSTSANSDEEPHHNYANLGPDPIRNPNGLDPVHRPRAIYPGADNSSTVRFHIPEPEDYADQESLITAPNSPAITEADSMATSLIGLLRTPEHEEQRTRFDLASRLTSPNPSTVNDPDRLPSGGFVSSSNPPSPNSPPLGGRVEDLMNRVNDMMVPLDAPTSSAYTQTVNDAGSESGNAPPPNSFRPLSADNVTSGTGSRGAMPSTTSRALVRSKSTPTLRHSPSSSTSTILSIPSESAPNLVVLRNHRRLTRTATVLMEVLIHFITGPGNDLDWERIESSIHEGIREGDRRAMRRMLGAVRTSHSPSPQAALSGIPTPTTTGSGSVSSSRSGSPELPERCWTPS